ncbi:MAG TPA: transcriptional coactivator p15/PC4 family protein [Pirellulaceae bacterium]|nr:transcriptional coactivator p15/PC4 family protein [Pirellulaceae bacterium]
MNAVLPTEPHVVGEFEKNSKEVVRVTLHQYAGNDLVGIRAYYEDKDGNFKPGKGINIRVEQFPHLASLLAEAGAKLKELKLI